MMVNFGPDSYKMATTWKSSQEIAEKIGDPLQMSFKLVAGQLELDIKQVVGIIWIGIKADGGKLTYDQVGELVHKHGFMSYAQVVAEYLIDTVSQGSSESDAEGPTDVKKIA